MVKFIFSDRYLSLAISPIVCRKHSPELSTAIASHPQRKVPHPSFSPFRVCLLTMASAESARKRSLKHKVEEVGFNMVSPCIHCDWLLKKYVCSKNLSPLAFSTIFGVTTSPKTGGFGLPVRIMSTAREITEKLTSQRFLIFRVRVKTPLLGF